MMMSPCPVLLVIGSLVLVLVCSQSVRSAICSKGVAMDNNVAATNSSLIFEAQLFARKLQRGLADAKLIRWKVLRVHRGESTISTQSNVVMDQKLLKPCKLKYSNVSYLIFADSPRNNSRKQATKDGRGRPIKLIPKWITVSSSNISVQLQSTFCENCDSATVLIKRQRVEVKQGEKIEFTCEVSGISADLIYWTKNHVSFNSSGHVQLSIKRRGSQLKIDAAAVEDAGTYRCHARSTRGLISTAETRVIVAASRCTQGTSTCEDQSYCLNGGVCCVLYGSEQCKCPEFYGGKRCASRASFVEVEELLDNARSSTEQKNGFVVLPQVVFAIVIIAAMLVTVLLIVIFVLATKMIKQRRERPGNRYRASKHRHYQRGNKSVSTISPVPFITISSDFQISPVEAVNDGAVFPVPTDVECDYKCVDPGIAHSRTEVDDVNDVIERLSNRTQSTQSLRDLKWESSDVGDDDDDDVKANRASDADVLDVGDDRCVTSTSRFGDRSAMSSQYGGDTTSWTQDGDSDVDSIDGGRLLRQLYAYNIEADPSLDDFAAGGVLPSLMEYIGNFDSDSPDDRRDIELVPTVSSVDG